MAGRVTAVFESSFYIKTSADMFCIGTRSMGPGALNVVTTAPSGTVWHASGLQQNARAAVSSSEIRVGNRFIFALSNAVAWLPERPTGSINPVNVKRGLEAFLDAVGCQVPDEGIGRFLVHDFMPKRHHHVYRAALSPITEAQTCLSMLFQSPELTLKPKLSWIHKLAGLGPGLTPSGDDFLGGMMIALHELGESKISDTLWPTIRRVAEATDNVISLAHLSAAAEGVGSEGIHRLLSNMLRGDIQGIQRAISEIDEIGHCSGWDAMTGVVVTLRSWLAVQAQKSPNFQLTDRQRISYMRDFE